MSPSPRSKSESESSRETGDATPDATPAKSKAAGPVDIELEFSRNSSIGWAAFGILFGSLLVWKLGTVGVWIGIALILYGIYRTWVVVQSFMNPPGIISIRPGEVSLPRGISMTKPYKVHPKEVTAVYFLRRSVPWNRSAPVLVVELGPRALAYPRDWFASEADQRHVVHALLALAPIKSADS